MSLPASNGETVLISGINGYIASSIGLDLLRKGYTVRGTSRSTSAKDDLLGGAFKGYESRYEHEVVPDITETGAFDKAVKGRSAMKTNPSFVYLHWLTDVAILPGVHAIIHTASPIDFSLKTIDEFMHPAVNGNLSILNSTLSAGPQLKSFVLTSSIAAIVDISKPDDYAFTEDDWNVNGEEVARKEFRAGPAYGASKAAAERAMWRWKEMHGPSFSLSAVNPGVVTGPPVSFPSSPGKLNETLKPVWLIYSGEAKTMPAGIGGQSYIDVRDVSRLHIWCMEHPDASNGQRYIAANGKGTPQAAADILRKAFPDRDILVGEPESDYVPGTYDYPAGKRSTRATKAYKALGGKSFIGYEQSILDTVKSFEERWPGLARTEQKEEVWTDSLKPQDERI